MNSNLQDLTTEELNLIQGGQIPGWIKALGKTITVGYIVTELIDNWAEVKEGFSDGLNTWSRK